MLWKGYHFSPEGIICLLAMVCLARTQYMKINTVLILRRLESKQTNLERWYPLGGPEIIRLNCFILAEIAVTFHHG